MDEHDHDHDDDGGLCPKCAKRLRMRLRAKEEALEEQWRINKLLMESGRRLQLALLGSQEDKLAALEFTREVYGRIPTHVRFATEGEAHAELLLRDAAEPGHDWRLHRHANYWLLCRDGVLLTTADTRG